MAKRSKGHAKARPKKKKAKAAMGQPGVGAITIALGNVLALVPAQIDVNPDSDVTFVIANQDGDDHDVYLDPGLVVIKGTATKKDPFAKNVGRKNVPAGQSKVLTLRTKTKGAFPNTPITFKYTVQSFVKGGPTATLDPDLEVSTP